MEIRKAQLQDLESIMAVYVIAKQFMQETGNKHQWIDGYPSSTLIMDDIQSGNCYVCTADDDEIVGVFYYRQGTDKTYAKIYEGKWLNDEPYGVIHRLAGTGKGKGIAAVCLNWCFRRCNNIRVDTHRDNLVMQQILKKNGYTPCGIIYIENGTERLAFHKC